MNKRIAKKKSKLKKQVELVWVFDKYKWIQNSNPSVELTEKVKNDPTTWQHWCHHALNSACGLDSSRAYSALVLLPGKIRQCLKDNTQNEYAGDISLKSVYTIGKDDMIQIPKSQVISWKQKLRVYDDYYDNAMWSNLFKGPNIFK